MTDDRIYYRGGPRHGQVEPLAEHEPIAHVSGHIYLKTGELHMTDVSAIPVYQHDDANCCEAYRSTEYVTLHTSPPPPD